MRILSPLLVGLLLCTGCGPKIPPKPPRTQLEIRQSQTREYRNVDSRLVMKALLNTLQDDGFIVKNAVTDLGLITAVKELDVEDMSNPFSTSFGFGTGRSRSGWGLGFGLPLGQSEDGVYSQNSIIEVSANVTELRNETRVRVNFQQKTVDNRGGTREVRQIEEPGFYQDFFAKVDKGIFLQRERL